jgi:DNA repair protein SbcC/Rad50
LGLDRLDALERGLEASRDIRNTRKLIPAYLPVEREQTRLRAEVANRLLRSKNAAEAREAALVELSKMLTELARFGFEFTPFDSELTVRLLDGEDETRLSKLTDIERQLSAARRAFERLQVVRATSNQERLETELAVAESAVARWRETEGVEIANLFRTAEELSLPPGSARETDVAEDLRERRRRWQLESDRLQKIIVDDEAASIRHKAIQDENQANEKRLVDIAGQMTVASDDIGGLRRSLAAILPHIHGPDCPVCSRDFSEVSEAPLADVVATRIADLGDLAERLTQLSRDQASGERKRVELERETLAIAARILNAQERLRLQDLNAKIQTVLIGAERLQPAADRGAALLAHSTAARRSMDQLSSTDSEERALRAIISEQAAVLKVAIEWETETLEMALARLEEVTSVEVGRDREIMSLKDGARRRSDELSRLAGEADRAAAEFNTANAILERTSKALRGGRPW